MRVHLLAPPNTETTPAYFLDGFAQRTILFADVLQRLGIETILYGVGENTAPCQEFVSVLSVAKQQDLLGGIPYQTFVPDTQHPLCIAFNANAAVGVRNRKCPGDIIATICGNAQHLVADANLELPFLEYSVGYRGVTMAHRVYQSHAWRHVVHGFSGVDGGRVFDAVIPPWFHATEFPFEEPEDYVLYCGRLTPSKGIAVACEAAWRAGMKLVVIGHGNPADVTYGDYVGAVGNVERNQLIAKARAVLMPTQYLEPFGNVAAEAQLCGTPVISTDFGAFTESVEQGVTGYRCTSLGEWIQAIDLVRHLDRIAIRARAMRLYSTDAAVESYRQYFRRLNTARGEGWRDLTPSLSTPLLRQDYGSEPTYPRSAFGPETTTGWDHGHLGPVGVPSTAVA